MLTLDQQLAPFGFTIFYAGEQSQLSLNVNIPSIRDFSDDGFIHDWDAGGSLLR